METFPVEGILFTFISKLLMANINSLAESYPTYEQNVEIMITQLIIYTEIIYQKLKIILIDLITFFLQH